MGRISMPQGRGSQLHNRREYDKIGKPLPDNIDGSRTGENMILVDMKLEDAYQTLFRSSVSEYNSRQKRYDRIILDYLDHIRHSKNGEKEFYEDVIQWGSKDDFERDPSLRYLVRDMLKEYVSTFETRNPNLKLIGAYIHMDEASPHLHLDYIPVATGYKTGMKKRNSLDRAMKQMGFVPDKESRINNATKMWKDSERTYLEGLCRSYGLEVEAKRKARGSLSVEEYKEIKDRYMGKVKAEDQELRRHIEANNAVIQDQSETINFNRRILDNLEMDMDCTKRLLSSQQTHLNTAEIELEDLQAKISEADREHSRLKAAILTAKETLQGILDKISSKSHLEAEINDLEARRDVLKAEVDELQVSTETLLKNASAGFNSSKFKQVDLNDDELSELSANGELYIWLKGEDEPRLCTDYDSYYRQLITYGRCIFGIMDAEPMIRMPKVLFEEMINLISPERTMSERLSRFIYDITGSLKTIRKHQQKKPKELAR